MIRARLTEETLRPAELLSRFMDALGDGDGAVVSFAGMARATSKHGAPIDGLFLQHHPRLTERSLAAIASDGASTFSVSSIEVVHRCGAIQPREAIVWVAVAAPHRRTAFDAAEYLMDRLKTEALFWKREDSERDSVWIEPTAADYADRARWE